MLFGPQGTPEAMRMLKGPWSILAFLPEPGEAWLSCAFQGWAQAPPSPAGSSPCRTPPGRPCSQGARDRRSADHGGPTPIPWAWPAPELRAPSLGPTLPLDPPDWSHWAFGAGPGASHRLGAEHGHSQEGSLSALPLVLRPRPPGPA